MWAASAVIVLQMEAESAPISRSPVLLETFVRVLVRFGVVLDDHLEAAGPGQRGSGCVVCWAKNGNKRAFSPKNLKYASMVLL